MSNPVNTLRRIRQLKKEIRNLKKHQKNERIHNYALLSYYKNKAHKYKQMYTEVLEALEKLNKYNAFVKPYKKILVDHLPTKTKLFAPIPTFSPEVLDSPLAVDYHVKLLDWLEAYGQHKKDLAGLQDAIMINMEMSQPPYRIHKAISFTKRAFMWQVKNILDIFYKTWLTN